MFFLYLCDCMSNSVCLYAFLSLCVLVCPNRCLPITLSVFCVIMCLTLHFCRYFCLSLPLSLSLFLSLSFSLSLFLSLHACLISCLLVCENLLKNTTHLCLSLVKALLTYFRLQYTPYEPASSYVSENSLSYISNFLIKIPNVQLASIP